MHNLVVELELLGEEEDAAHRVSASICSIIATTLLLVLYCVILPSEYKLLLKSASVNKSNVRLVGK